MGLWFWTNLFKGAIASGHEVMQLGEHFQSTVPNCKLSRQVKLSKKIVACYCMF